LPSVPMYAASAEQFASAFRAKSVPAEVIAAVPLVFLWDFITKGATIPMAIASSKMRAVTARTVIRRVRTNAKAASNATPAAMSVVTHHDQPRSTMTARLLATARKDSAPADQAGNVFWAFAYNIAALPLVARHVLAVVAAATGAVLARRAVRANERGYQAALRFAGEAADGARAWAVEGTGSYGAGLARYLAGHAETVLEVSRTPRSERRLRGKDDSLDAARAARAALASETLALPRSGERREALRLLLVARRSAVDVRREALGQLRGVIVTAPDRLRE